MASRFEVSGAGTVECNGIYTKSRKKYSGKDAWEMCAASGAKHIIFSHSQLWVLAKFDPDDTEERIHFLYYVRGNEQFPAVTGWSSNDPDGQLMNYELIRNNEFNGNLPAPTCTALRKRSLESVGAVLGNAWKQRKFTDAEVVCCGMRIPVHRSTLSAASPVFEAHFSSPMKDGETAVYEIRDSTPEAVEALLCFVYTGEQPAAELLSSVSELALQYELEDLAKLTAKRMAEGRGLQKGSGQTSSDDRHRREHEHENDEPQFERLSKYMKPQLRFEESDRVLCNIGGENTWVAGTVHATHFNTRLPYVVRDDSMLPELIP